MMIMKSDRIALYLKNKEYPAGLKFRIASMKIH